MIDGVYNNIIRDLSSDDESERCNCNDDYLSDISDRCDVSMCAYPALTYP